MSNGTKYWTWHMAAGVVLFFLLGLHMLIMHMGGTTHLFAPHEGDAVSQANSLFRDGKLSFTLTYIKENLDPTLVWRYSCRMGICGSCGMLINGSPTLACNTQILHVSDKDITVGPLPNFNIIRDLVPDLLSMFEKHASVSPHIIRDEAELNDPKGEFYQSPKELEEYLQFTYCIKCGCCMGACPTLATDVRYLGPMPLTAAQRYNADTRDAGRIERNEVTGGDGGAFRCHYAGECSRVCPKGVDPGKAVQLLKRKLVLDYLHLASKQQPCKKLEGPGHGKPLPNMNPPVRTIAPANSDSTK